MNKLRLGVATQKDVFDFINNTSDRLSMLEEKLNIDTTKYNICVKIDNGNYKYFNVPYEIYTYIKQLETFILYPERSKLKEFYSDCNRFK
jgi:hypothetical protein